MVENVIILIYTSPVRHFATSKECVGDGRDCPAPVVKNVITLTCMSSIRRFAIVFDIRPATRVPLILPLERLVGQNGRPVPRTTNISP